MTTAKAGGGDEERFLAVHGSSDLAHGREEELHPSAQRLSPAGQIQLEQWRIDVEGGKPVHALDRPGRREGVEARLQVGGRGRPIDGEDLDTHGLEPVCERGTDTAVV